MPMWRRECGSIDTPDIPNLSQTLIAKLILEIRMTCNSHVGNGSYEGSPSIKQYRVNHSPTEELNESGYHRERIHAVTLPEGR